MCHCAFQSQDPRCTSGTLLVIGSLFKRSFRVRSYNIVSIDNTVTPRAKKETSTKLIKRNSTGSIRLGLFVLSRKKLILVEHHSNLIHGFDLSFSYLLSPLSTPPSFTHQSILFRVFYLMLNFHYYILNLPNLLQFNFL